MIEVTTQRRLATNVAVAAAYALAGYGTLALGSTAGVELRRVLWIGSGVALAVSLLVPFRVWPGAAVGALFATLLSGSGLLFSVGTAFGNGFEIGFATWLLRRLDFRPKLDRPRDTLLLVALAAGLAAALAAAVTTVALALFEGAPAGELARIWLQWWLTHAMGILLVVPPALAAVRYDPTRSSAGRGLVAILAVLLVVTGVPFGAPAGSYVAEFFFVPLLVLLFAAMQYGTSGAASGALIVAGAAIVGAVIESGPLTRGTPNESLVLTWSFVSVVTTAALIAGAAAGEWRRAGRSVVEGTQRLRAVLDATRDGILVVDSTGHVTDVNPTILDIAGEPDRAASIGKPVESLLASLRPAEGSAVAGELILNADPTTDERHASEVELVDGRFLAMRTAPLISVDGVSGRIWSVRDVTEIVHSKQERQRLQDQILHSQKLEGLGVLAGGVAHDFNNLLMGITGFADLLLGNDKLDPESREDVEGIVRTAGHASQLCGQMLAYAGKTTPILVPVDLSACATDIRELLAVSVSKRVELVLDLPDEPVYALADLTQIRQVLLNLVTNGSEAVLSGAGHGSVVITVESALCDQDWLDRALVQEGLQPGAYAILQVEDDGVGLQTQDISKVFDPFYSSKGTGRGLGLAATLGVIRGHGGTLVVESTRGEGTCFRVALPLSESGAVLEEPRVTTHVPTTRRTVLVVDDEDNVRHVVARMIERAGYATMEATDGDEALEILERCLDDIDLVLLDLTMPRRDGLSTLHEMRERGYRVPVLVASGYSQESLPADVSVAGFVHKPFRMQGLSEALEAVLPSDGSASKAHEARA